MTSGRWFLLAGLLAALAIGMGVSYAASGQPDGLESAVLKAACDGDEACLEGHAGPPVVSGLDPDYSSGWLAGLTGVAACFVIGSGLVLAVRRRRAAEASP
ncbi:MAG TPA: PDGLE domain-containing protein [Egibacteraceae bacterium]|nr:PDGLE domain-containing protein [Egibacteraceae bacterium]